MQFGFIADIFFPQRCVACGTAQEGGATSLCFPCRAQIPINTSLSCGTCGIAMAGVACAHHPEAPYVFGAATAYNQKTVKLLIYKLKFDFVKPIADPLADMLADYALQWIGRYGQSAMEGATVIPIPLSKKRERWRGFNQSALIGNRFAKRFCLAYAPKTLTRMRDTKPQSETESIQERLRNVSGCFGSASPAPRFAILIDDVATSGSTLHEAAAALRSAGAEKIIALAIARA